MDSIRGVQVFSGYCPDPACRKQLFFPSYLGSSVECTSCGQHHEKDALLDVRPVSDPGVAIRNLLQNILISSVGVTKKCAESVKVKGLSNYQCKLISPLLTKYGFDRATGTVRLLQDMGQGSMFDCSHLSDRAFQIEEENLNVQGYGVDKTGAKEYLSFTLEAISQLSGQPNALFPIHADGDGHCLVHAVSRALVGRELFWHPLMKNLKENLTNFQTQYKLQFQDFIDEAEWRSIIAEADPDYEPTDGEPLGLRNIHIFGLANVLRRPIILLDGQEGITSVGHYGGVYLPALCAPNICRNKEGILNKPLAIAWSSSGRNHFVPLIGLKSNPPPKIPRGLMPVPWGVPSSLIDQYIDFDGNGMCTVGGAKCLQDKYLQKLVTSMEGKFQELNRISPELVADVYHHVFKPSGVVGVSPQLVTEAAQVAVEEERLYRCLTCHAVIEDSLQVNAANLKPNGQLYEIAVQSHGKLKDGTLYRFPQHNNIVCRYDKDKDMLIPKKESIVCKYCQGSLRLLNSDGGLQYFNGDRTTTVTKDGRCGCGYKHYWDGKEYDNLPERLRVVLDWNNTTKEDFVHWFQYETDPSLNSNAYELAQNLIQRHFPGEFGSERLKQRVVDQIFRQTIQKKQEPLVQPSIGQGCQNVPTKIILTGEKAKSLHKEELGVSNTEKVIKKRIEHGASVQQKRTSSQSPSKAKPTSSSSVHQQELPALESAIPASVPPPQTSSLATSPSPSKEKKIRLSVPNSSHTTVSLADNMTFHDLQEIIEEKLGVPKEQQIIKFGFPPKILQEPDEHQKGEPLPLQHGDRLLIDRKVPKPPEVQPVVDSARDIPTHLPTVSNEATAVDEGSVRSNISNQPTEEAAAQDPDLYAQLERGLLNVLGQTDLWIWAQDKPYLFQPNGLFYNQVQRDIGPLVDGQHCTLPCFPGKVFSYNQAQDQLYLCLGKVHLPIQPLSPEMLSAMQSVRSGSHASEDSHTSYVGGREVATLGGLSRKDPKIVAFSGKGRSLSEDNTGSTCEQKEVKESSAVESVSLPASSGSEQYRTASNSENSGAMASTSLVSITEDQSGETPVVMMETDTMVTEATSSIIDGNTRPNDKVADVIGSPLAMEMEESDDKSPIQDDKVESRIDTGGPICNEQSQTITRQQNPKSCDKDPLCVRNESSVVADDQQMDIDETRVSKEMVAVDTIRTSASNDSKNNKPLSEESISPASAEGTTLATSLIKEEIGSSLAATNANRGNTFIVSYAGENEAHNLKENTNTDSSSKVDELKQPVGFNVVEQTRKKDVKMDTTDSLT